MILLPPEKYGLVVPIVKSVGMNNLFARFVTEKYVHGKVYVDDAANPKTIYVVHPYGMSLLTGDHSNHVFNSRFREYAFNNNKIRKSFEWMQTYPHPWDCVLNELFGSRLKKPAENSLLNSADIEIHTRVNFAFNKQKFPGQIHQPLLKGDEVVKTDAKVFSAMPGSVIPARFWNSADDFLSRGKGFSLLHNGEIASTAYSAYVLEDKLEIGIETVEKYRGMGFAFIVCKRLIDYCIESDLTPVWSCRHENTGSYNLALKLGFEPVLYRPFYRLSI